MINNREDTGAYYCNLETINYKQPGKKVTLRVIDGIAPDVLQVIHSLLGHFIK